MTTLPKIVDRANAPAPGAKYRISEVIRYVADWMLEFIARDLKYRLSFGKSLFGRKFSL